MRRTVPSATLLLAAACATPASDGAGPSLRRGPADRWREASRAFEAELAERGAAPAPTRPHAVVARPLPAPARERRRPFVVHDVSDLVTGVPSFVPPQLGFGAVEDDDFQGFGGVGEYRSAMTEDDLVDLITSTIDPESWDEEGNSIEAIDGRLIVRRK